MTSVQSKVVAVVAVLAAVAVVVPHTGSFVILLTTRALAFSILVMSVDILLGFTGLASMGQAAYLGIGAYLTAILATRYHFGLGDDFWLVIVLAMLCGAVLAAFFGLFAMRASGVYFLMITLALGQCVWGLAYRWNSLTGGDNGINLSQRPRFFGIDLANEVTFFYLVFAIFAASLLVMYVFVRSPFGRSLVGIRERELRMKILGYNTWLHKYIAFIIAGAFGGLSGVLWAPANEAVVKSYRSKYGKVPSYFSESNYTTAMMIDDVMKQTGGKWPGAEAFIAKMAALHVDAPRGPLSFDDMRNVVQNVYIKKVEKTKLFGYDKPELWDVVIKTYPNVSQFWTYGKDAFLKQPVYSRDFPPCKFCE